MKFNIKYLLLFMFFLIVEIIIAKYVRDSFIRPYVGDVLVVILIYCFVRIFLHQPLNWLPAYIFVFAISIEILQLFNVVSLLGLNDNKFARIIIGTVFDFKDIVCYSVGTFMLLLWQNIENRVKYKHKLDKDYTNRKAKYIWSFVIILFLFLAVAFNQRLTVTHYTLKSDLLKENQNLNIVLIADLHSTIYGNKQQNLITTIKNSKPDLILLAGDIADDVVPIEGTKMFLDGLKDTAPIYYVTGNHEYWSNDINSVLDVIKSYGATILTDNFIETDINGIKLIIAGVEDPEKKLKKTPEYNQVEIMNESFKDLHKFSGYKILLAHRPEQINEYIKYPFDLVVSGHAHGGQVRFPLILNGLLAPNQGWFPKYTSGVYMHDELAHIVSRGLSINPRLPRVFNPPEVVVIKLEPDNH